MYFIITYLHKIEDVNNVVIIYRFKVQLKYVAGYTHMKTIF